MVTKVEQGPKSDWWHWVAKRGEEGHRTKGRCKARVSDECQAWVTGRVVLSITGKARG